MEHPLKAKKQTPEHIAKRMAKVKATKLANGEYEKQRQRFIVLNKSRTGIPHSAETKKKLSEAHKGKNTWTKGSKQSLERRKKQSDYIKAHPEKHNFYIDGRSFTDKSAKVIRQAEMRNLEYREWRTAVYKRDGYTCQECGIRGGKLNADHIKPWTLFPEYRYDLDNGRTLCESCHKQTHTYASKAKKLTRENF